MKGQCLCGAVSISVPQNENVHACHCNMCQRWNGGPLFAFHCEEIEVEGNEHIYPLSIFRMGGAGILQALRLSPLLSSAWHAKL